MVEEEKEVKQPFKDTTFGKILLVLWEIIYYGVIYLIGSTIVYSSNDTVVPLPLLIFALILLLYQHKSTKSAYKKWLDMAQDDEFQARFTWLYRQQPLLPNIIAIFFFARFCSIGTFIILFILLDSLELWERRFFTSDAKHDLILNELKQTNRF